MQYPYRRVLAIDFNENWERARDKRCTSVSPTGVDISSSLKILLLSTSLSSNLLLVVIIEAGGCSLVKANIPTLMFLSNPQKGVLITDVPESASSSRHITQFHLKEILANPIDQPSGINSFEYIPIYSINLER